jgi:outer membrane protein TolC
MNKIIVNNFLCSIAAFYLLTILLFNSIDVIAQTSPAYTLDSLQQMAESRYPLFQQLSMEERYGEEAIKDVNGNWLPKLSFVGSATEQSEVTKISLPPQMNLSIESPAKDQYKIGFELSQLVFDWGVNSALKSIERENSASAIAKVKVEILKTKTQLNNVFTAILVNKEALQILYYVKNDLAARYKNIKSGTESGLILKSTCRELEAEIIKVEQKIIDNKNNLVTLFSSLSALVQEKLDTSATLVLPDIGYETSEDFTARPEYKLFSSQIGVLDWRKSLINRSNMPKLAVFANGYYGRSGYNYFDSDFRTYGMAGVSLSWSLSGNYTLIHQKAEMEIGKEKIDNQRTLFEIGIQNQIIDMKQEIKNLNDQIEKDNEIVLIRSEVKQLAIVQYENGTITTTDYILKLNAESQALIDRRIHKIQLEMAHVNYKTLLNQY